MLKHNLLLVLFLSIAACGSRSSSVASDDTYKRDEKQCTFADKFENLPEYDKSFVPFDSESKVYNTPTRLLKPEEWPNIVDDLGYEGMDIAITRQLSRFNKMNLSGKYIRLGGKKYSLTKAPESLEKFQRYVRRYYRCQRKNEKRTCEQALIASLKNKFNMFKPELAPDDPRYGEDKQTFFTSYYTPLLRARTAPDERFKHAIFKNPRTKKLLDKTRVQIDFDSALSSKGLEIAYTEDLFDLYLLHVQGGGRVVMEDKSGELDSFYISYDGTNGKSWRFISNYMFDQGYISNKGIPAQRNFLKAYPSKEEEIYKTCPSYVFFKRSNRPPLGNDDVSLTDNRSIATDTNYYSFKGLLSFVEARRPVEDEDLGSSPCGDIPFQDFSRFYLDQDTGGAIRGKARVDLYAGEGPYAELSAYNTKEVGNLYFLLLK